ncbi:hypothetical protein [Methylobacterium sp. yr668]|uniref:hypothetical protein n=1 Tax=Methylobacterium sp. yr668 TaxID=1761801 RepID=UPI0008EE36BA|nr:hypothetical protein [Methylobacterium sp. yr668]SFS58443.1 hypothetical protein SAMN04487845_10418 [Methylobacterium sp. yr668]
MTGTHFLPDHRGKHFCFDKRGLEANVEAAALIGRIITDWARVEHELAMLVAALLGDAPRGGLALFGALWSARQQRDALTALASAQVGDGDTRALISDVLQAVAHVAQERHDIAHGVFGWSFDLPELTLWVKADDLAQYHAEAWHRFADPTIPQEQKHHDDHKALIRCYAIDDLKNIRSEIAEAKQIVFGLYGIIRQGRSPTSPEFETLSSAPLVQRVRSRRAPPKKSSP